MTRSNGKREPELSRRQLEIVMHLCNGKTMEETAEAMHYSTGSLQRTLKTAKKAFRAKSTVHLASIVIAKGMLVYTPDELGQFVENAQPAGEDQPATQLSA